MNISLLILVLSSLLFVSYTVCSSILRAKKAPSSMAKKSRRQLAADAPWRTQEIEESNKFEDAKMKVTNQPGSGQPATITREKSFKFFEDDDYLPVIDPQIFYGFQKNFQFLQRVFTVDTLVKPLPPAVAFNVTCNMTFFTRIFTQFFDPEGISRAQKSMGIRAEDGSSSTR